MLYSKRYYALQPVCDDNAMTYACESASTRVRSAACEDIVFAGAAPRIHACSAPPTATSLHQLIHWLLLAVLAAVRLRL